MRLWLFSLGAVAMLGQVVLLRELGVAFYGSELIYVLALGFWLLGTAAGAALARGARVPGERRVRWTFLATGVAIVAAVLLARRLRSLLHAVPGAYLPLDRQVLALGLCIAPPSLLLGAAFPWLARRYIGGRRTVAAAYALESLGAIAGGLLSTLLLAAGAGNLRAAFAGALLAFAAAGWPLRRHARETIGVAALAMAIALGGSIWAAELDRWSTRWTHPQLLAVRDTPYARVTVTRAAEQIAVFEDDALAYESESTAAEVFAGLAMLQRSAPAEVLVLGGAAQGLVAAVLEHHPAHVDDVELDGAMVEVARRWLPVRDQRALADPRVRVVCTDPRRRVAAPRSRPGEVPPVYDAILVGLPEPETGRANRCYTREFFAACAGRLAPDGVLALRLRGAENLWTPQLVQRAASVERALREVYSDVVVVPGGTNFFLASRAPLDRDPERLAARLRARDLSLRLLTPAYVRYLYTNDRFEETAALLARAVAPPNTDLQPLCYRSSMVLWLARFFPQLTHARLPGWDAATPARMLAVAAIVAGLAGGALLARRRTGPRRVLLAATAGFAGMVLEAALLLAYQTRSGVLYQDLGVLLTAFMAGLALGAATLDRWMHRRPHAAGGPSHAPGVLGLVALAVLSGGSALLLRAGVVGDLLGISLQLLASGFLVAVVFAHAAAQRAPDPRAVASPVYAADLAGGCAGALVAGWFAVPVLGPAGTAALAALAALVALPLAAGLARSHEAP